MSASALPPTAPTTLVIMLGASAWPNSPGFQTSEAFLHAAQGFREYVLDPHGLGLPTANLCDLFDAAFSTSDQLEMLGSFLEQRTRTLQAAYRDVLVYFVGHGGFAGPSADFYLMPRRANASSLRASGMAIDALAEVLQEKARQTRRYLFLDCCFAAAAFRSFQGGPDQTAITKTLDAFAVQTKSSGFPQKGTVLLCSSDQKSPSLLLPDESCTMFSYALLDVLRNGDLHRPPQLSLRDIKELAEDRLAGLPQKNAPRPSLHSPDQSEGDVANVALFPNPYAERRQAEQARLAREAHVYNVEKQTSLTLSQPLPPTPSPSTAIPEQGPISPPRVAIPPQRSALLPTPPLSRRPKRQHSPAVSAILILLSLILLSLVGLGIYRATTGNGPGRGAQINTTATIQAKATATAQAQATATARVPGRIWHIQPHPGPNVPLQDVAWSGSQLVVVSLSGIILTSPNGSTWTAQNSGASGSIGVIWAGSQFVAVGYSGANGTVGTILTSPDGSTWTPHNSNTTHDLYDVAWSGAQFVAVGNAGTIMTSPDGSIWTPQPSGTSSLSLSGVVWSHPLALFVVVGDNGTILTSPDGSTWTAQTSGTSQTLQDVVWSGSQFVAVGSNGTILTSPDGSTWTARNSDTSQDLLGVAWSGSQFVAVGSKSTILTSPDGSTWIGGQRLGTSIELSKVVWSGSQFVAVGGRAYILTSP
jgi:hypothetical protein